MTSNAASGTLTGAYWKHAGGGAWAEHQGLLDRLNQPVGDIVAERADPGAGARVLDVGCGAGATTLEMARRVGPEGQVVGIDVSEALLELGRKRARAEGVTNVNFLGADAGTHDFGEPGFDAAISRYGVMFFEDPDAAFANLRRAVRRGGGLTFACWRSAAENPLTLVPLEAAAPFLPELPRPPAEGPGRFAFADADRVRGILDRSGWRRVAIEPLDVATPLSFDELMTLSLRLGPLGTILPDQGEEVRERVRDAVATRFKGYVEDGMIPMTAACWLVTATA
ncbi:class I SAM-dependent methyltransferase [Brevundimonas sp.]|uniref:class I SAM-dependent methyltransferase n=1 Tax=Brevundimonas sp. TaxID=1871086 RepID=UPI002731F19E|nr:class I SAM-dependent methyltransferase [Brevundimonas sp.]MDP1913070.1 class I SAM-dependent methyltransferase [Brevundimonas sp.]